jgi:hypothetical protein
MIRFPVSVAFGLTALLIAPSLATAQVAREVTSASRDRQPSRPFSRISFGVPVSAPAKPVSAPTRSVSRPPGALDMHLEGGRLPEFTTAPEAHGTSPDCVIRVVPVDPRAKSRMPVVTVDERADPKGVIKIPECKPRQ